ncbi:MULTISPECIES: hypothetical protein [unclassified Thioalkalivibrio]|uniref:chorismate transformation enzyme, FkbO/Hyg5 family n=1 Tax=unclassified Thioalkalivibrio TaxID=2621013 RepID=UPI000477AA8F|nr:MULTISPECIES: hypothetical protein [unclassified Thioalkalivibrio]
MAPHLHSRLGSPVTTPQDGLHVRLEGPASVSAEGGQLRIVPGLEPLAPDLYVERWWGEGPARSMDASPLHLLEFDDVLFAAWQGPDQPLRDQTQQAYDQLLRACRERGFEHPARIWNYFSDIHGDEQDRERYQAFCVGRAEALEALEVPLGSMPAATAIGTRKSGLFVYLIATRSPAQAIENPRQVSAYHYPKRYSPKSPTFARATLLQAEQGPMLMVSGTASIVGHESRHAEDVVAQARETVRNLHALHDAAGRELPGPAWLRVYLRHPEDRAAVAAVIAEQYKAMNPGPVVQWVRGDICRPELLLEIEGVHA